MSSPKSPKTTLFSKLSALLSEKKNPVPAQPIPIIVGGCHRSGTTLIRRILNAHSRIHCGPEVKFFRDFYNDYLNDPIKHIRYVNSARALLPEPELISILGQSYIKVQERAAELAGKVRWADKNPENVLYLDQWQSLLGNDWLMVHIIRNPLDTIASIKDAHFKLSIPPDIASRVAFYEKYTKAGLKFGKAHPERYFRLQYESLVTSPEATLEKLMTWLGEKLEPQQMEFNEQPQQAGLGDWKVGKTSKVHSESMGRWAAVLDEEEVAHIRQSTDALWEKIREQ